MALKVAGVFVIISDSGSGGVCFEPCLFRHLIFLDKKHLLPLPTQVLKSYFVRVPSYLEALWYPHLYFDRKSNI